MKKIRKLRIKKRIKNFITARIFVNEGDINDHLLKLKERYKQFNCPHELVCIFRFLNDVKDFMNCKEKKCLTCGYWVYIMIYMK